jgi:hypothetical protein
MLRMLTHSIFSITARVVVSPTKESMLAVDTKLLVINVDEEGETNDGAMVSDKIVALQCPQADSVCYIYVGYYVKECASLDHRELEACSIKVENRMASFHKSQQNQQSVLHPLPSGVARHRCSFSSSFRHFPCRPVYQQASRSSNRGGLF